MDSLQTLVHSRSPQPSARRERHEGASQAEPIGELLLGRYRLLERLGSGGFAVVWRAQDEQLGRVVALKRIPLPADGERDRAAREARATARLSHPAIVALHEAYASEHEFYLISELVEGHTLKDLIAADQLSDREIFQIGIALAGALTHAHAHGVIHRDLKPQNVLVPSRHEDRAQTHPDVAKAKLADFGGARLTGEEALTLTGDVLGTLAYMAPEQSEGLQAGPEADLYSLALVLYEALSGLNPVRGATPAATARRIGEPIQSLRRYRRDLTPMVVNAIDQALSYQPEDRGTITELRQALELALQDAEEHVPQRKGRFEHRSKPLVLEQTLEPQEPWAQPARWHQLPRGCWWALAASLVIWQASTSNLGVALLLLAGVLPLIALPRRASPSWLSAALAPILGLIGLAGAYPAIAGQRARWYERAGLAALAYWWLTLAEPLSRNALWLGTVAGTPPRSAWEHSLDLGATHVVYPLLSIAVLLGCLLWALAAMVLPWIVRGHSAGIDLILATIWASALAAAEPLIARGAHPYADQPVPHGVVLSAVLCGAIAVAARATRGPL